MTIDIELKEGKLYYFRYWKKHIFKRNTLEHLHAFLREIDLNEKSLRFYNEVTACWIDWSDIITIVEIKSKGKRILEILNKKGE